MQLTGATQQVTLEVINISSSPEFNYFFTIVFFFGAFAFWTGAVIDIVKGARRDS